MALGIALDVYGTLVDPLKMADAVYDIAGDRADAFAQMWREKQLEYSWRHSLMQHYVPFDACAIEGLRFAARAFAINLAPAKETELIARLQHLRPYRDVLPGIAALRAAGHKLFAFSNGTRAMVTELLGNAGLLDHLDGVISVDDVKAFKPDPRTYELCVKTLAQPVENCWLVSSNPFDCIGAKAVGMHCVWVKRRALAVFDPWGGEPDITVDSIEKIAATLQ